MTWCHFGSERYGQHQADYHLTATWNYGPVAIAACHPHLTRGVQWVANATQTNPLKVKVTRLPDAQPTLFEDP